MTTTSTRRIVAGAASLTFPLALAVAPANASAGGDRSVMMYSETRANVQRAERRYADVSSGPSRWQGRRLRHPEGGRFYPAVMRWANLTSAVLREKRIGQRYLKGVLAQIQQESSGNPYAINLWDSNAAAGHPSKGLLQIIAPTYRAYAKDGYRNLRYQTVPYTNLWASLEYVIDVYGKRKFKSWNRGYNQGY